MRKFWIPCLLILMFTNGCCYLASSNADYLAHPPRVTHDKTPADYGIEYRDISFVSDDENAYTLKGWYIPPAAGMDGATIIYVHGLEAHRGWLLPQAEGLIKAGFGALLFDLRNHGESEGELTTLGIEEQADVRGALKFLAQQPEVNMQRLGIMGRSMGGAVVIRAAYENPIYRAVVAQSTFTSFDESLAYRIKVSTILPAEPLASMMNWFYKRTSGYGFDEFDSLALMPSISNVMIIHGIEDDWVPVEQAKQLHDAAAEPKRLYLIEGAQHYPLLEHDPVGLPAALQGFFERYLLDDIVVEGEVAPLPVQGALELQPAGN